ncbi:uncharacterized protein [Manis javanica]|uniref:uncharacterized protein n=1 Tax=Manis javanica TaxID=9974 RepID=UPI003C6D9313
MRSRSVTPSKKDTDKLCNRKLPPVISDKVKAGKGESPSWGGEGGEGGQGAGCGRGVSCGSSAPGAEASQRPGAGRAGRDPYISPRGPEGSRLSRRLLVWWPSRRGGPLRLLFLPRRGVRALSSVSLAWRGHLSAVGSLERPPLPPGWGTHRAPWLCVRRGGGRSSASSQPESCAGREGLAPRRSGGAGPGRPADQGLWASGASPDRALVRVQPGGTAGSGRERTQSCGWARRWAMVGPRLCPGSVPWRRCGGRPVQLPDVPRTEARRAQLTVGFAAQGQHVGAPTPEQNETQFHFAVGNQHSPCSTLERNPEGVLLVCGYRSSKKPHPSCC